MMDDEARSRLLMGLATWGLDTETANIERLSRYLQLITQWNRVHNLTAIKDERTMVSHHLLDSLSVLPYLQGERILDVGSGAGLPGIPLALYRPESQFTLLDASIKRVRFQRQCIAELGLQNVVAIHARIEKLPQETVFDTVISRAFASLEDFAVMARRAQAPRGHLLAMKGRYPDQELGGWPAGLKLFAVHELIVPGLDARRHLVDMGWESNGQS